MHLTLFIQPNNILLKICVRVKIAVLTISYVFTLFWQIANKINRCILFSYTDFISSNCDIIDKMQLIDFYRYCWEKNIQTLRKKYIVMQ